MKELSKVMIMCCSIPLEKDHVTGSNIYFNSSFLWLFCKHRGKREWGWEVINDDNGDACQDEVEYNDAQMMMMTPIPVLS